MPRVGKCPCGAKLVIPDVPLGEGVAIKCASCGRQLKIGGKAPAPRRPPPAQAPPPVPEPKPAPEPAPEPEPKPVPSPAMDDDLPLELEDDEPVAARAPAADADEPLEFEDDGDAVAPAPVAPAIGAEEPLSLGDGDDSPGFAEQPSKPTGILADAPPSLDDTEDAFELASGQEEPEVAPATPEADTPEEPTGEAAKCPNCGEEVAAGSVICLHCGLNLASGAVVTLKVVKEEGSTFWAEAKKEFKDKMKTWGCVFIIVGVLLLAMLIMKLFR